MTREGKGWSYIGLNVGAMVFLTSKVTISHWYMQQCLEPKMPSSVMVMKPESNQSEKSPQELSFWSVSSERDFTLCLCTCVLCYNHHRRPYAPPSHPKTSEKGAHISMNSTKIHLTKKHYMESEATARESAVASSTHWKVSCRVRKLNMDICTAAWTAFETIFIQLASNFHKRSVIWLEINMEYTCTKPYLDAVALIWCGVCGRRWKKYLFHFVCH